MVTLGKYLKYKLIINKNKWILAIAVIIMFSIFTAFAYDSSILMLHEWVLVLFDNRLFLYLIFTCIPLVVSYNYGTIQNYDVQIVLHYKNVKRWYDVETFSLLINGFVFSGLCFLIIITIGKLYGYASADSWVQSFFYENALLNPDSFDFTGNPMSILIYQNSEINYVLIQALILYGCRIFFYSQLLRIVNILSSKVWLSIAVALVFGWLEVNLFLLLYKVTPSYILPFEHSVVTSVNGTSIPIYIKLIYWGIVNLFLYGLGKIECDRPLTRWGVQKTK